ncbi:MAG: S41 family peptidase [Anaerolineae bacterium]|nr:S41 family peptidase [Anaerolineae bacterium]
MRAIRYLIGFVLVVVILAGTFTAGFTTHFLLDTEGLLPRLPRPTTAPTTLPSREGPTSLLGEAWRLVDSEFMGELPDAQKRTYGAIHGMIATLNDPYTTFVEPQPRQLEKDQLRGEFGGIGVYLRRDAERRFVLEPMADLPAEKAGILKGDILLAVDGKEITPDTTQDDVAALVRGEIGSKVRLTVQRAGVAEPLSFTVTRQRIETPSVEWRMLPDTEGIGYIAAHLFNEKTGDEVRKALRELRAQGMKRLVLDLRNNPGGLVDSAVDVASEFMPGGVVAYERRRDGPEKSFTARRNGTATDLPLVIVVNGGSASASEIVAGALQDLGRAKLIGEKTYGKGSVQLVHDLSDGSSVHVTVSRWYTPHRRQIDQTGLVPDVEAGPVTDEDRNAGRDPVLARAVEVLQNAQG